MNDSQLLLIDLSGLAHQIWHTSGSEPDPSFVSTQIIARVRSLASAHPHAAICCDTGKSFRADLDPSYKAHRDTENRAPLRHQMDLACETLARDGFPVWRAKGFEADDIIATAVREAAAIPDTSVLIASSDKDLLQLVNDRVSCKSLRDGKEFDAAAVQDKFKVTPAQMLDYLCLVGDTSDNIIGAKGIGGVTAAKLLSQYQSLENIYAGIGNGAIELTPSILNSLTEFRDRWPLVRSLVTLRTDAPIEFSEIAAERVAAPMEVSEMSEDEVNWDAPKAAQVDEHELFNKAMHAASAPRADERTSAGQPSVPNGADSGAFPQNGPAPVTVSTSAPPPQNVNAPAFVTGLSLAPSTPIDFSQQLEPRTMPEAKELAKIMFDSRLFGAYGTPQSVLAVVIAGREMGMGAMASLRGFHIIENKPQMSADTMAALVLKSGKAKYFRCVERTDTRCTFVTQRLPIDDYPEQRLTVTIEEMRAAWKKDQKAWDNSGWGKVPASMLVAACKRTLARLEYPDVVGNLYDSDEML